MTATLQNLIANDNGLRVFCDHCHRCVDLDVEQLVNRYSASMELPVNGGKARCGECGGLGGSVQMVAIRS